MSTYSVIQYGQYKLFTSYEDSQVYSPPYTFSADEKPQDASYRLVLTPVDPPCKWLLISTLVHLVL